MTDETLTDQFLDSNGNIINYYSCLNVSYNADINTIKNAFRTLIKRYHPDVSCNGSELELKKLHLVIQAYHVLSNDSIRRDYDEKFFKTGTTDQKKCVVPIKRVRYSALLSEMLRCRFLPKGIRRKDILKNFGQDVEILILPHEQKNGAVAYLELPSRMPCPVCWGENAHCYICKGIGRVHSRSKLAVTISPGTKDGTYIDFDLRTVRPDRFTTFRARSLRIKITVLLEALSV